MKRKILACVLTLALFSGNGVFAAAPGGTPQGAVSATPEAYRFQLQGNAYDYILAEDDLASVTSRCFAVKNTRLQSGGQTTKVWDSAGVTFDPGHETSVAGLMNPATGSIRDTWTDFAPDFLDYIDYAHVWTTEAGPAGASAYSTTCGIAVLSHTEWTRNIEKIGYGGVGGDWFLRTPNSVTGGQVLLVNASAGSIGGVSFGANRSVRPCFWLHRDFFKEVRLNLDATGEAVFAVMRRSYAFEELRGLYSVEELLRMGFEPSATVAGITFRASDVSGVANADDAGAEVRVLREEDSFEETYTIEWTLQTLSGWTKENVRSYAPHAAGTETLTVVGETGTKQIDFPNAPKGIVKA
ncbi:MAG: hypothetical protein LBH54_06260, partial [Clostridiales bacterium]|nr:hypothetical protein [Clostridiales bacterium]